MSLLRYLWISSQKPLFLGNYQLGMFLKIHTLSAFNLSIVTVCSMQQGLHVNSYVQASTPPPKKKRKLPSWIQSTADHPHAAESIHSSAPDGVFNNACAVLNDGLLLLEFRMPFAKVMVFVCVVGSF